jgi:hypothetical protein
LVGAAAAGIAIAPLGGDYADVLRAGTMSAIHDETLDATCGHGDAADGSSSARGTAVEPLLLECSLSALIQHF